MAKTFEIVYDHKDQYERQMKISLLSDYVSQIETSHSNEDQFLVIVTSADHNDQVDHFEESLNSVREAIESGVEALQTTNRERSDYIGEMLADQRRKAAVQDKERQRLMERSFAELQKSVSNINYRLERLEKR